MLTGINERTAKTIASKLGITNITTQLLPQEKAEVIVKLKSQGKIVAIVGDGIKSCSTTSKGRFRHCYWFWYECC